MSPVRPAVWLPVAMLMVSLSTVVEAVQLNGQDRTFVIGDADVFEPQPIVIGLDEALASGGEVWVRIQNNLLTWDTVSPPTVVGTASAAFRSDKILVVTASAAIAAGGAITVNGLRLIASGTSARQPLLVSLGESGAAVATTFRWGVDLLTLGASEGAYLVGDPASPLPELTIQGVTGGGLAVGDSIQLILPTGFPARWDSSATPQVTGKVAATVAYDGATAYLPVTAGFDDGERVTVSGLRLRDFTGVAVNAPLTLSVNATSRANARGGTLRVGRLTVTVPSRSFLHGDPSTPIGDLVVSESTTAAGLTAGRVLRLRLPEEFSGDWDPQAQVTVTPAGRLAATVDYDGGEARLTVTTARFQAGESVRIQGLAVTGFDGASAPGQLTVVANDAGAENARSTSLFQVGQLQVNVADQAFLVGDGTSAIGMVTISESDIAAGLVPGLLRLRLPTGFTGSWNPVAPVTVGGVANKLDLPLSYDGDEILIEIADSLSAGESITLSGLQVQSFSGPAAAQPLVLAGLDPAISYAESDGTLRVGQVSLGLTDQAFLARDPTTALGTVTIRESTTAAGLVAGRRLRLRLPQGFTGTWVNPATVQVSDPGKVSPTVTLNGVTAELQVLQDFVPGEEVTIDGLLLGAFSGPFAPSPLVLQNGSGQQNANSDGTVRVGELTLTIPDRAFLHGNPATSLGPVRIDESSVAAGLTPGRRMRLRLPTGFRGTWAPIGTITLTGDGSANLSNIVTLEDSDVVLEVTGIFQAGQQVTVDGLALVGFDGAFARAPLVLLAADNVESALSSGTIRIGHPRLESATGATFLVNDVPTALPDLTLTESDTAAGLVAGDVVRIVIPGALDLRFDTTVTTAVTGNQLQSGVTYSDGDRVARLTVASDLAAGSSVRIAGLRVLGFEGRSAPVGLSLRLNDVGVDNDATASRFAIGTIRLESVEDHSFVVGDGTGRLAPVIMSNDEDVSVLQVGRTVRLSLPSEGTLRWNADSLAGAGAVLPPGASGRLGSPILGTGDSVLVFIVEADVDPGTEVVFFGLPVRVGGVMARGALRLSLNQGRSEQSRDPRWIQVGAPLLASDSQGVFDIDEDVVTLPALTLREHETAASITPVTGLLLRWPPGSNITWRDPGSGIVSLSGEVNITGSGAGRFGPTAAIVESGRGLQLTATTPLEAGEVLRLAGLSVQLIGVQDTTRLELVVTAPGVDARDTQTVRVGDPNIAVVPTLAVARDSIYAVGDSVRFLPGLELAESATAAVLNTVDDLLIELPESFGGRFLPELASGVVVTVDGDGEIAPVTATDYVDERTLRLDVTSDFRPGNTATLTGIAVYPGRRSSAPAQVRVSALGGRHGEEPFALRVGAPRLRSETVQSFVVRDGAIGDSVEVAAPMTITESDTAASIVAGDTIVIAIPEDVGLRWNGVGESWAIGAPGSPINSSSPTITKVGPAMVSTEKHVQIPVREDFAPGDSLKLSGFELTGFESVSPRSSLRLSVTNGSSYSSFDPQAKRIGRPLIASRRDERFIAGFPKTGSTSLVPIVLREDPAVGSIDSTFVLRLPAGLGLTWGEGPLPFERTGLAQAERLSADLRDLVFRVARPLEGGDSLVIDGLLVAAPNAPAPPERLELSVNGGIDARDSAFKRISGPPSIDIGGQDLAGAVGDPDLPLRIRLLDHETVPAFVSTDTILLVLPSSLQAEWTSESVAVSGPASPRVLSVSPREIRIGLDGDLAAGDSLIVAASIGSFVAPARPAALRMSAMGDTTRHVATTAERLRIGAPQLRSVTDQVFVAVRDALPGRTFIVDGQVDSVPRASRFVIREDSLVASITADRDIRVVIPETLAVRWVGSDPVITGSGRPNLPDSSVTISAGGDTLLIDVAADFAPGDSIVVTGMRLGGFDRPSRRAPLILSVNGGRSTNATDSRTKRVGRPTISARVDQRFLVGESNSGLPVLVVEDSVESVTTPDGGLRVTLTTDVGDQNLTWAPPDAGARARGRAGARVRLDSATVDSTGKVLLVPVTEAFEAGDTLWLDGLRVRLLTRPGRADSLLSLSVGGDGDSDARSAESVAIGDLTFSTEAPQVFWSGDWPEVVSPISLVEDPTVPILLPGDTLRIHRGGLDFRWLDPADSFVVRLPRMGPMSFSADTAFFGQETPVVASIEPDGVAAAPAVADDATVEIVLQPGFRESFDGALTVSGLRAAEFGDSSTDTLFLSVGLAGDGSTAQRFVRRDTNSVVISAPSLTSAVQTFLVGDPAPTRLVDLHLMDDAGATGLTAGTLVHLYVPAGLDTRWDTTATLTRSDSIRLVSTSDTEVVLQVVTSPFGAVPIRISGLAMRQFGSVSPDDSIELGLSHPGNAKPVVVNAIDSGAKRIGQPSVALADGAVFVSQRAVDSTNTRLVPPAPIPRVTIAEDIVAAALLQGDRLYLEIPQSFPATWALDREPRVEGRLRPVLVESSGKSFAFEVTQDFPAGGTASVDGLHLQGFDVSAQKSHPWLRVRSTYVDTVAQTLRIGSPRIFSDTTQVFVVGENTTSKWPITIIEDSVATILKTKGIELLLPSDLQMSWDTTQVDISRLLGGRAADKISGISYSAGGGAVRLVVATDFEPLDTLVIGVVDSLRVTDFRGSSAGALQARVDTLPGFELTDPESLFVGAPSLASVADQAFVRGLAPAGTTYALYPIVLTEDARVATMRKGNLIRFVLPEALSWAGNDGDTVFLDVVDSAGTAANRIEHMATIRGDTAMVRILETFAPQGRLAIVGGLAVHLDTERAGPDTLGLSVTTSGRVHSRDSRAKWIGQPHARLLSRSADFALDATALLGDARTGDTTEVDLALTIRDSAAVGAMRQGRKVRIALPEAWRGIVAWKANQIRPRVGVDAIRDFEVLQEGHVLELASDVDLDDGDEMTVIFAVEAIRPDSTDDMEAFIAELTERVARPTGGGIELFVELASGPVNLFGRDMSYSEGLQRPAARTADSLRVYLPMLFAPPEVVTDLADPDAVTRVRFVTWPGLVDSTVSNRMDLRATGTTNVALFDAKAAGVDITSARVLLWGQEGTMQRVARTLTEAEVRRLNRWYDDDPGMTPRLQFDPALLPALPNDADQGTVAVVRTPHAAPKNVLFADTDRYFAPGGGGTRLKITSALHDILVRAVLHGPDGVHTLPPDGVTVDEAGVTLAQPLDDGLYELWLYGASDDPNVDAGLPTVRQFVVDGTRPEIRQDIDPFPVVEDSVGLPRPLAEHASGTNTLRPLPLRPLESDASAEVGRLVPVWNGDSLKVRLVDNIVLEEAEAGPDTLGWVRTSVDSSRRQPVFFRLPSLPSPLQLVLAAASQDGDWIDPPATFSAADFAAALGGGTGTGEVRTDDDQAFPTAGDPANVIHVDVDVVPTPEGEVLVVPLSRLPGEMTTEGTVVSMRLTLSDLAGNDTTLGLNEEQVRLLLASAEVQGVLLDKLMNFPNPFRTVAGSQQTLQDLGTTIRFVLTADADVRLRVFDVAGEQLYVANLGPHAAGEHLLTWPGRDIYGQPLATGVYFAILEVSAESGSEVERTILAVNNRE